MRNSVQGAMPSRSLVLVPSRAFEPWLTVQSTPFSACKLPYGTTRLELVTSGRSVTISSALVGQQSPAVLDGRVRSAPREARTKAPNFELLRAIVSTFPAFNGRDVDGTRLGQGLSWSEGLVRLAIEVGDRARRLVCRSPPTPFDAGVNYFPLECPQLTESAAFCQSQNRHFSKAP